MPTSVLIVDDHPIVRRGIKRLLEARDAFEVVDEAENADEAISQTLLHRPDVVILDLELRGRSGLAILPQIRTTVPSAVIVVLSMHSDPEIVTRALAAGANAYVPKEDSDQGLFDAIDAALAGRSYVTPSIGARLAQAQDAAEDDAPPLRPQDAQLLRLVALGHTNREIGELLGIHPRNAERRRIDLMRKLGARTRAEMVRTAIRRGLFLG